MKKILLIVAVSIGISTASVAQMGQETTKKEGFFHRLFHNENKPRKQMAHFDEPKKDPNIKHNGTAYWRRKKEGSKVE